MESETTQRGPVFIGGTGRSGTTLLVRLLDRHSQVSTLRWESQFLVAPNGLINLSERRWRPRDLENFVECLRGRWYERTLNPGKDNEYKAGLVSDVEPSDLEAAIDMLLREAPKCQHPAAARDLVRRVTHRVFDPVTQRENSRRWCEKTPRNVLFADRLFESFPDMKFIHIVRDGRDVVSSMAKRGFWPIASGHEFPSLQPYRGKVTVEKAAAYWVDILRLARIVAANIPDDHYMELRFEDLIAEPEVQLRKICEFLGQEFEPALLDQNLERHNIGRWKEDLSPGQQEAVMTIAGETLERKDYLSP